MSGQGRFSGKIAVGLYNYNYDFRLDLKGLGEGSSAAVGAVLTACQDRADFQGKSLWGCIIIILGWT